MASRLRRLTKNELTNTVRDLARFANPPDGEALSALLAARLEAIPDDQRANTPSESAVGSFKRVSQTLDQAHVDALYALAAALGAALTTPERLLTTVGTCARAAGDATTCVSNFIQRFGSRALRRPLTDAELAFYKGVYGNTKVIDAGAFADVVTVLLNAPAFYYHVETGEGTVANGMAALTPFELASRLSYHFWETMPDEGLWRAAETRDLLTPAGYRKQVERLFTDARARKTLEGFVVDWLRLDELERPSKEQLEDVVFKSFAADMKPSARLRDDMVADVVDMVSYHVWDRPESRLDDLLRSDLAFPRSLELARIYGVPAWDGKGAPPAFAPGVRPGLITRAAMVANVGHASTRPIIKGVHIRRALLCDAIPPPPPDAAGTARFPTVPVTSRREAEIVTEEVGGSCAACHKSFINPLGFVTESFDALGRRREVERLFDQAGKQVRTEPVDTKVIPQVELGDMTAVDGPAGLVNLVIESGKANACLTRHYFRYTFARFENDDADGCTLSSMHGLLTGGAEGSLSTLMRDVALTPAFLNKVVGTP